MLHVCLRLMALAVFLLARDVLPGQRGVASRFSSGGFRRGDQGGSGRGWVFVVCSLHSRITMIAAWRISRVGLPIRPAVRWWRWAVRRGSVPDRCARRPSAVCTEVISSLNGWRGPGRVRDAPHSMSDARPASTRTAGQGGRGDVDARVRAAEPSRGVGPHARAAASRPTRTWPPSTQTWTASGMAPDPPLRHPSRAAPARLSACSWSAWRST